ncbi:sodium/hydrogen exchanger, putative [Eimeria tenella]|uniref:Sodium/hydrogen exchanger, putative n=1 Tax=Eimeria tenella TaxID=5802 RepID=U6KRA9_EIMTE|nr:sodium/hydrogen exchanger, putative [Eimeria tenella]CDJ40496.1 sodium/hydrogen exchanger, putative [Eimeria tenella]|eukprot:XP_013231246.1 sodium/hydrogen exchanger, putative [Eimeria tenella]
MATKVLLLVLLLLNAPNALLASSGSDTVGPPSAATAATTAAAAAAAQTTARLGLPLPPRRLDYAEEPSNNNNDEASNSSNSSSSSIGGTDGSRSSSSTDNNADTRGSSENDEGSSSSNSNSSSGSSNGSSSSSWEGEAGDILSSSEKEVVMSVGLLLLLLVVAAALFISLAARRMQQLLLQVPLVATLLGVLLGALLQQQQQHSSSSFRSILALKEEVFFVLLLPPIVFQGGLELVQRPFGCVFAENFGGVLWLAVGATVCSTLLIGTHMLGAGLLLPGVSFSPRRAFAVGALISSTDPVAVLSAFRDLRAKMLIHVLVFGESLLNDAVTLVMYRAIADGERETGFAAAAAAFLCTFAASTAIGLLTGAAAALVYKHIDWNREDATLEVALLMLFPWLAFLIADGCGFSGIVSICFCGVSMGKYAFMNLSQRAQVAARSVFGSLALLSECLSFVFLGLAPFSFDLLPLKEAFLFLTGGAAAVVAARALSVYLTCFLMNFFRGRKRLSLKEQHAVALCGLRGTVAFALAERAQHDFGGREGQAILTFTLVVCLSSVLLLTPALLFALRPLGVFADDFEGDGAAATGELPLHSSSSSSSGSAELTNQQQQQQQRSVWCKNNCCEYLRRRLRLLDRNYLTPFFASPLRPRGRPGEAAVELQQLTAEEKQQQQQQQQQQQEQQQQQQQQLLPLQRRRGHEVYLHLPQATEAEGPLAAEDLAIGEPLQQQKSLPPRQQHEKEQQQQQQELEQQRSAPLERLETKQQM